MTSGEKDNPGLTLPTYKVLGKEIVQGATDNMDSLDLVELAFILEDLEGDNKDSVELSDRERRMAVLQLMLREGEKFMTTMFGMAVEITPVSGEPTGGSSQGGPLLGDDPSGDREPRIPTAPHASGGLFAETKL